MMLLWQHYALMIAVAKDVLAKDVTMFVDLFNFLFSALVCVTTVDDYLQEHNEDGSRDERW